MVTTLSNLQTLDLSGNMFSGPLPQNFSKLVSITYDFCINSSCMIDMQSRSFIYFSLIFFLPILIILFSFMKLACVVKLLARSKRERKETCKLTNKVANGHNKMHESTEMHYVEKYAITLNNFETNKQENKGKHPN